MVSFSPIQRTLRVFSSNLNKTVVISKTSFKKLLTLNIITRLSNKATKKLYFSYDFEHKDDYNVFT